MSDKICLFIPCGEMSGARPEADEALGEMLTDVEANSIRDSIPLNPLATPEVITSLKGDDPLDCIFRVYYRENNRGWVYDDSAYEDIVKKIISEPVFTPSCYGHQSPEAVAYEGRPLKGTVIGVLLDKANGFVYYRIIPDSGDGAKDVRRWLKNKQINAVSIWGFPTIMTKNGKTHVVNYDLRSIDFVPPHTEGQKNDGVSIGEMSNESYEAQREKIQAALHDKYPDDGGWSWVEETYPDYIIARHSDDYYKIAYTEQNSVITLGDAVKVSRVVTYEIIQEVSMDIKDAPNDALLAEIKRRKTDGVLSVKTIAGEMGIPVEDETKMQTLVADSKELAEIKAAAGEMKPLEAISLAKAAVTEKNAAEEKRAFGEMVNSVKVDKKLIDKDGKATGEMNACVDKFAKLEVGMTRDQISGEMDRVMNDEDVKKIVSTKVSQKPLGEMHGSQSDTVSYEM
jgi:hypothetical protein